MQPRNETPTITPRLGNLEIWPGTESDQLRENYIVSVDVVSQTARYSLALDCGIRAAKVDRLSGSLNEARPLRVTNPVGRPLRTMKM